MRSWTAECKINARTSSKIYSSIHGTVFYVLKIALIVMCHETLRHIHLRVESIVVAVLL
jgi:hypothetical protein